MLGRPASPTRVSQRQDRDMPRDGRYQGHYGGVSGALTGTLSGDRGSPVVRRTVRAITGHDHTGGRISMLPAESAPDGKLRRMKKPGRSPRLTPSAHRRAPFGSGPLWSGSTLPGHLISITPACEVDVTPGSRVCEDGASIGGVTTHSQVFIDHGAWEHTRTVAQMAVHAPSWDASTRGWTDHPRICDGQGRVLEQRMCVHSSPT